MRRWLEPAVRRLWEEDAGPWSALASAALVPMEIAYRGSVAVRNAAYDVGWVSTVPCDVPVVSVGNILVGGAGKTPVAAWAARILADASRAPAVAMRGYGSDERRLHRRWNPDVPVFADRDRSRAVAEARDAGCRSAVLDDGFQHRRLRRDLDLVLLPIEGPWRVRLLPRGPFREPLSALQRADRIILTRRTGDRRAAREAEDRIRERFPELPVAHLRLAPAGWTTPSGEAEAPPHGPLLAVSGIARPDEFRELVGRLTDSDVELLAFPDHHDFTEADLESIRRRAGGRGVVTTEKDAVRLPDGGAELGRRTRVLRLRVEEEDGATELRKVLLEATARGTGAPAGRPPSGGGSVDDGSRPGPT